MVTHFVNFLVRTFEGMPSRIGSNWGGLVFTAVLFLITELVLWRWGEVKVRWGWNTLIGFAVAVIGWTLLFCVSAVLTIYDDHENLAGAAARIKKEGTIHEADCTKRLQVTQSSLDTANAVKEAISGTLEKQNREQQGTINGCLSQALKLVSPTAPQLKYFPISNAQRPGVPNMDYILTTNVPRTPVDLVAQCDFPIADAIFTMLTETGGSTTVELGRPIEGGRYRITISSPTWTVSAPIKATLFISGAVNRLPSCSFTAQ